MSYFDATNSIFDAVAPKGIGIAKGEYKDSVHKITLMTTLETVQRILNGK